MLHPYPTWEANELPFEAQAAPADDTNYGGGRTDAKAAEKGENILEKDSSKIISTFRIRVDECDRLWVMDSGLADILGSPKQWAPNSIAVFDLNTDKLIRRFIVPADQVKDDSFFANIVSSALHANQSGNYKIIFFRSLTLKHPTVRTLSLTFPIWVHTPLSCTTTRMTNPTALSTTTSILTLFKATSTLAVWTSRLTWFAFESETFY